MILDTQEIFSGTIAADGTRAGQAITATALSTNVLDLRNGAAPTLVDEGLSGPELWLVVQAITAANGADSAKTLTITFESATDAAISSGNVAHFTSAAILGSAITAGANLVRVQLPSADYKRYIGVRYTVSAGFTSFQIAAFLTMDVNRNITFPSGYTIDV